MEDCVLKALSVHISVSGVEHGRTSGLFVAFPEFIFVMLCFLFCIVENGRVGGRLLCLHIPL